MAKKTESKARRRGPRQQLRDVRQVLKTVEEVNKQWSERYGKVESVNGALKHEADVARDQVRCMVADRADLVAALEVLARLLHRGA